SPPSVRLPHNGCAFPPRWLRRLPSAREGGAMAQETTDVLVAGYQNIEAATADFEALVALVKEKKVAIEGVILVTHAEDGAVAVRQPGDKMGRKGVGRGAG